MDIDNIHLRPAWAKENSFSGIAYHGAYLRLPEDSLWTDLSHEYGEWQTVWVTPDEQASEAFSTRFIDIPSPDEIPFVIRMEVDLPNLIDLRGVEDEGIDELMNEWCPYDLRECIQYFNMWGFDGWITTGSIAGLTVYNDIAVWNGSLGGTEVKLLRPNGLWTPYMSEDEANEVLGL